ncbi:outer membrane protein [Bradyrhizobium sp. BWC-3-1]|uniref:outer membrane protein n=1 Tax=Bradyrhizobium sp. BWC-3-1 TaxID=3080012 RepID=UPI00397B7ADF
MLVCSSSLLIRRHQRARCQAETPLTDLFKFAEPALNTFRVIWTTGELGGESKRVLWGGALAAGFEYGFAPNWSIGFEYAHLFMRPTMVGFTEPAGGVDRIRQDLDLMTARLNYKFGGPILLKY